MPKYAKFGGKVYLASPPKTRSNGERVVSLEMPGMGVRTVLEGNVQYTDEVPDWARETAVAPKSEPTEPTEPTEPRTPPKSPQKGQQ